MIATTHPRGSRGLEANSELAVRVREVLARTLELDASHIVPEAILESDLRMDSLKTIATNVALEQEFGFVADQVARPAELGIRTVSDLVDYVSRQLQRSDA